MRDCDNCPVSPDDCDPLDCEMEKEKKENSFGMTLRDYFAGQVITGLFSAGIEIQSDGIKLHKANQFAELAYNVADAMILERNKE